MSGIDTAAAAFEVDMGNSAPAPKGGSSNNDGDDAVEVLFDREHENDEIAGGDEDEGYAPSELDDGQGDDEQFADPDEDEEEQGDDDEGDDEDDEHASDFDGAKFSVVVDGETIEVTGAEMRRGYIGQETFHRRMNKLSEAGRAMETVATGLFDDRTKLDAKLAEAEETIKALVPDEPDWDALFKANPASARQQQKTYENIKVKLAELKKAREENQAAMQEQNSKRYDQWRRTEHAKVMANNPEWAGENGQKIMQRDVAAMAETAFAAGFTKEEVEGTHDSRMLTILKKAAAYDRLQKKRPQPVNNSKRGKPQVNHGAGSVRTAPKGKDGAQQQLRRSGTLEDATAVFGNVLQRERKTRRR